MVLHAFLQAALAASVEEVQQAFPAGTDGKPLGFADMLAFFEGLRTDLTATQQTAAQLRDLVGQQGELIGQLTDLLRGKASADSVAAVRQRLGVAETALTGKADTAAVSQQFQAVAGIDSAQAAAISAAQQMLATDGGILQSLLAKTVNYDLLLPALRTDVDAKAASATVSNLTGQVTTLRNAVNDPATGLSTRAATADLATQTGRVDTLVTTTVPTLTTAIGNRLRKDQADTTTFPLGVPIAAGMDKAVQKSELVGGIQRPYRVFQNVAATPVGAYVRTGQAAQVVDTLGLGQVLALTAVRIKPTVAPLLASVIKLYSNGVEVYSATVALATVPAVGKSLDLLALTGASLPLDISLPAVLTMSASAGTFEIIAEGILK